MDEMNALLEAGSELAGYRVERLLGQGGMGVVYLARDTRLDRPVALKVVRAELAGDTRFRDWFLQESQLAAGLDHPSIVPVYSAGDADGVLYLAMRYVDGRTLRDVLKADSPLAPDRALRILGQLAAALDAAHATGMVHRDVKPANVLLTGDPADRTEHAYLADFGLAKRPATADSVTGSGALLGTISYAAPEQIEGADVDGRADIYSLGCLLFECLTGRPPFSADSDLAVVYAHLQQPPPAISTVGRNLPAALDPVIAKALAKKPADRYRTAGAFVEAARAAFPGSVVARRSRRSLAAAAGLAAAGIAALGGSALYVGSQSSTGGQARSSVAATPPIGDAVVVLDARTGRNLRRIALPAGSGPADLTVADGVLFVANSRSQTISEFDARTGAPLDTIPAAGVTALATGDGTVRAIAQAEDGKVSLRPVDRAAGRLGPAVTLPARPLGPVVLTPGRAWFTRDTDVLPVLTSVATDRPGRARPLRIGQRAPIGPVVANGGSVLALAQDLPDGMRENLVRVDQQDRVSQVASMSHHGSDFDPGHEAIAVGPGVIWSLATDGTLWQIDPARGGVTDIHHLGSGVWGPLTAGPDGAWAGDSATGSVTHFDPRHPKAMQRIPVGGAPNAMRVDGGNVYVATTRMPVAGTPPAGAAARGVLRIVASDDTNDWDGTSYLGFVWPIEAITCNALLDYRSTADPRHQGDLIPAVAAGMPAVSPDGRTYAFTIRRGLRFSDGSAVDPTDVVDTYLRNLSPKAGFDALQIGYFDDIVGARAYESGKAKSIAGITIDGDSVRIRLNHADGAFAHKTAMRVMCIVPRGTPRAHQDLPPPTTAPFEITRHLPGRSVTIVPNPVWVSNGRLIREPTPRGVRRIEITLGLDDAAQVAAIRARHADLSQRDPTTSASRRQLLADPLLASRLVTAPEGSLQYLTLNTRQGPFRNRLLRLAANVALDRTWVAAATTSQPWSGYLPSTLTVGPGPFPLHGDVNAARRLVRTSRARPPIAVSLWYVDGQPATEELAKRAKEGLDAAGFAVRLRPIRNSLIYASAERSLVPMDMTVGGWGEDFPDAVTVIPKLLGTGSPWNYSHYASARADRLTAGMAQRPYGPARRQAWTALGDLLARGDAPLVVYGNGTTARLHSDRVGNVVLSYAKAGVDYSLLTLAP